MISPRQRTLRLGLLALIYLLIVFVLPRPATVKPEGWRICGLFVATVAGLILQPLPGGALVLIAILLAATLGGLGITSALGGYSDATVWLVLAAFFISRALINTGLARRIALVFVRWFGGSSLGVAYSLALSDATLATIIPSNGARSGGVVLPVVRSIAELYESSPGATAGLLGTYLMTAVSQSICVSAAMFFTGQASNPLAAQMAGNIGYQVTWASWLAAGIVPGALSLAVIPWVVLKMVPPQIRRTPKAPEFAAAELAKLGPMGRAEKILCVIFLGVCGMWSTTAWHGVDITVTALYGSAALLLTGVLDWNDVLRDHTAWDIFFWYGGLLRLGKALNDAGVTRAFADSVGHLLGGAGWVTLLAIALLIFFYSHYGFASTTALMLSLFPPFLALLVGRGAPPGLAFFSFACLANLSAGLTHYGTTPLPMFYAHGYVPMTTWWRVGAVCSVVNIAVWSTAGFAWWKLIGIW